jgi:hypothetical protein
MFDPLFLWSVVWKLSGEARDGSQVLLHISNKNGIESTRFQAEKMLERCKSAELAATMGWIELQRGSGDLGTRYSLAKRWVEKAKQGGFENLQMLLYLELVLSGRDDSYDNEMMIEQVLGRDDLPMEFTRAGLVVKMWNLVENGEFGEAEKIADRILSIEENAYGRLIKWVGCLKEGKQELADRHFSMAKARLAGEMFDLICVQGWLFLGDRRKAMEWLYKAKEDGVDFTENKSQIGTLVNSSEFEEFCKEKEG